MFISKLISLLDSIRKDSKKRSEIIFSSNSDPNAICEKEDLNYLNRTRIIYALFFDLVATDYELIKFCFEQEILFAKKSSCSFESNRLIAYLLSKFRVPENCLLFAEMKFANFDNSCGFDREFFFSAGVNKTLAFLESIELNEKGNSNLTDFLPCQFSDNDILKWSESKETYFSYLTRLDEEDKSILARELLL